jgi:hypothetical protein
MLPVETYRQLASLLPGSTQSEVARILNDVGARRIGLEEPFEIFWSQGRVDSINFTVGFPGDVPIRNVCLSALFREIDRYYEPGVLVTVRSSSGRNPYLIDLPDVGAEMMVELGNQNEVVKIVLMPRGRFRQRYPEHWQAMNDFMQKRAARRAEEIVSARARLAQREQQREFEDRLTRIADPDERLEAWGEGAYLWGERVPWLTRFVAWLRAGDADRLHDLAVHWNWDNGIVPLTWIVTRPNCEAATALAIFHDGEPIDQPEPGEVSDMLAVIRSRWTTDQFSAGEIGFKPPRYIAKLRPDQHLDRIPLSMRAEVVGRKVRGVRYYDGFPLSVQDGRESSA